jgi:hypothetical protein
MMRTKLYLRIALLGILSSLIVGIVTFTPEHEGARAAALPTPTINPNPGISVVTTARVIPGAPIPNRLNGGTCITVNADKSYKAIVGDPSRHDYMCWVDSTSTATKFRCEWGDVYDTAPVVTPTSTVGAELTNTLPFYIETAPTARMDCISESGNGCLDCTEE